MDMSLKEIFTAAKVAHESFRHGYGISNEFDLVIKPVVESTYAGIKLVIKLGGK